MRAPRSTCATLQAYRVAHAGLCVGFLPACLRPQFTRVCPPIQSDPHTQRNDLSLRITYVPGAVTLALLRWLACGLAMQQAHTLILPSSCSLHGRVAEGDPNPSAAGSPTHSHLLEISTHHMMKTGEEWVRGYQTCPMLSFRGVMRACLVRI